MWKLKFYWFKIGMTTNDKNQEKSKRTEVISKSEIQSSKSLLFCFLRPIQFFLHRMYCAGVKHAAKHFAVNHRGRGCRSAVRFNRVS